MRATREVLARPAPEVAPLLLGARLVSTLDGARVVVRLTEVEAYSGLGEDPGSHAHRGRTPRTEVMFGPPGRAYVYFSYGVHWCMNVVCRPDGQASAVLLRAGEVVEGADVAGRRRPTARRPADLARGPARLTAALGITGELGGTDLLAPSAPVRLVVGDPVPTAQVQSGPRTGVAGDGAAIPWRFWIDGDPTVSPYRAAVRRARG